MDENRRKCLILQNCERSELRFQSVKIGQKMLEKSKCYIFGVFLNNVSLCKKMTRKGLNYWYLSIFKKFVGIVFPLNQIGYDF